MGNSNRLIAENTAILYIKLIITSIIGLFTSRYIFRALGADDYGLYSVVGSVVVMMAFLNTVMITTTYRYIAYEMGRQDNEAANKVFNISLVIHLALVFIVLILTETIGVYYVRYHLNIDSSRVLDAVFVLRFSTYATMLSIVSIPFQGLVTALEKFSIRAAIEILSSILTLGLSIILLYFFGNRLRLYAVLMMFITMISSLLFILYGFKSSYEIVRWNFQKDKYKYKEMLGFSRWIMLGAAASIGERSFSAVIINSFFGTIINAAFGIANTVNGIISQFSGSLSQAAIPQITKNFSSGNNERSQNLVTYISKYTMFLQLLISIPILLETDFLINLWLGEVPEYTVIMTKLVIINNLISGLATGLAALVNATGKIKWYQIVLSSITLSSLPLAILLFKLGFPPYYITVSFMIIAIIKVVVRQILLNRIINFDNWSFIKTAYLKVFYVTMCILPLFYLIKLFEQSFIRFIASLIVSTVLLSASIYLVGLDKLEKKKIRYAVIQLRNKYGKNR